MKVSAELRYAAGPDEVYAMLIDPAFQDRKLAATGALSHDVSVETDGDGGVTIRTERQMPTDDVPDVVRSLVGPTLTLVQLERWSAADGGGSRSGTIEVEVVRAPVRLSGRLQMSGRPSGGGAVETVETLDGDLKAKVPLFGATIEKSAEPVIHAAIDVEQRTGTAWLAEH